MDLIITILPVVTKDLRISPRFTPYNFLSRCKFSTLTTRQPMVEFYSLTFPRFPLRKKEHKSYFGKNRTHDFCTSRCAGYLLDHSGDEGWQTKTNRGYKFAPLDLCLSTIMVTEPARVRFCFGLSSPWSFPSRSNILLHYVVQPWRSLQRSISS